MKYSLTWEVKCKKLTLQNIIGNLFHKLRKSCCRMERSFRNFQPQSSNRKFQATFASSNKYRKIPKISPGAYIFQRPFLRGSYSEGLIYGGNLRFKIDWARLIVGSKFTVFALIYFVFEGNFPSTSPRGACTWKILVSVASMMLVTRRSRKM